MDELNFDAVFPAATREDWLERVAGVLKGADFEKKLVARTEDGLRIEPLYDKARPAPQPGRAAPGRWSIVQRVDHPEPAAANGLALADLAGGADGLAFVYAGAASGRGFGVEAPTVEALERALEGVMLDLIAVRIEMPPFAGAAAAAGWTSLVERRGLDPAQLAIDLGLDPIGDMARTGAAPAPGSVLGAEAANEARRFRNRGFAGPTLRADARIYHEAGASEAQELAAALATAVAYLRALEAAGDSVAAARGQLSFFLAADADEFLTVAKLRALRRLWARVEEACGLDPEPIRLHAETAWRMTTRRDPWVNMLRATLAAFSAGIGGADSVTVLPFTAALGLPDGFARRIARNAQHVLLEEANLWRVADPAAGAGGFEALTDGLAEAAWGLFQEIESEGGIVESLSGARLQARIAATRDRRDQAVATRRTPITGTSEFPDLAEARVAVLLPRPERSPKPAGSEPTAFAPLPSHRLSEPFERLRDASDAQLAETGSRRRVFLANLGPPAAFSARASFARNFFAAGGFEALGNDGFHSDDALVKAYLASGTTIACLCSSDDIYVQSAERAARALIAAGCQNLLLAGHPIHLKNVLNPDSVQQFIFQSCNTISVLERLAQA